jgi:hypothetical protein
MNKIVASVGLVALGASGLQAAQLGLPSEPSKPWSISASLRGFYDDNINSAPDNASLIDAQGNHASRESIGFEVSPSVSLVLPMEQTTLTAGYTFTYKYYDNKPLNNADHSDMINAFNLSLDHAFSQRYQIGVKDSFVIGQEPDMLRAGNAMETWQRVPGDNKRNYGTIAFDGQLTRLLGFEVGYGNAWYDYADTDGTATQPSEAGLMNRLDHAINLDSRWQFQPDTVGIIGYKYRQMNYTADEEVGYYQDGSFVMSSDRDSRSQYGYAGLDHNFRPDMSGSLRAGGSYTEYYNQPDKPSNVAPYVLANLRWTYMPESSFEIGYTFDRNATDVLTTTGASGLDRLTQDQVSSIVYLSLNQKITQKLFGRLTAQYQNSQFQGGSVNNETEQSYLVGLNLTYRFNRNFSAEIGYSYDNLNSDLPDRSFDRNRVYLGVTAMY